VLGAGVGAFVVALIDLAAPFELTWDAPAGCPTEVDLRARIEELLGDSQRGAELRAVMRAHADERGIWTVDLRFETEGGVAERTLGDASSCRAAAEAAAVVVAIAIDPELALGVPEAPPTAVEEPSAVDPVSEPTTQREVATAAHDRPPPTPARVDPPSTEPRTTSPRARARGAIAIGPAVGFGTLPGAAGFGRVTGAVLWRRVRAGVGVAFAGGTPIASGDTRVSLWRWTVDAHACPVFAVGRRIEIVPCIGVEAGQTMATSRNLVAAENPRDPWIAAFVQPAVAVLATARFAVLAGGQLVVPFRPRRYLIDGLGEVFTTTPVGGGAFFALELRIP
jgi:hypothetical protein